MHIIESAQEFNEVIAKNDKVVVDFFASWCGPCKAIAPYFEELAQANQSIVFVKIDVDSDGMDELAEKIGVSSLPTFVMYNKQKEVFKLTSADKLKLSQAVAKLNQTE
jgi:thioredoxin 1